MLDLYLNIKKHRIDHSWTQSDLAKLVGYSDKSMIAKIEQGKVDLTQSKIQQFADVFGCSSSDLMGWTDNSFSDFSLSITEKELILAFREADAIDRTSVLRTLGIDRKKSISELSNNVG